MKTVCFLLLNEIINKILNYQIYDLFFKITKKFNERFYRFLYFFHHKNFESSNLLFRKLCGSGPFCVEKFINVSYKFGLIETLQTKLVTCFNRG